MNLDNEDGCIKHYVHLIKLKGTQGDVMCFFKLARIDFEKIERNFRKENATAIEVDDFSQAQAYFLINLFELTEKYNKLAFSNLLLRFFKTNLKIFKTICVSDHGIFI